MKKGSIAYRLAWGMRIINTPPSTPGGQGPHSVPDISTRTSRSAQVGTRPVQRRSQPAAGQSFDQSSGDTPKAARNTKVDDWSGLNYGPPVIGIARFFRAANTGYTSLGYNGWPMSGDNYYVIKRPLQRFPTRGARSVSGAQNPKSRWDDTGRAPSVFVPTTPVR